MVLDIWEGQRGPKQGDMSYGVKTPKTGRPKKGQHFMRGKIALVQTHRGRETDISLAAEPFHVVMMQEAQDHGDRPTTADSSS